MQGVVSPRGLPTVLLHDGGISLPATVDTGFKGDLELPLVLRDQVPGRWIGRIRSRLADGRVIEEDNFGLELTFDGEAVRAQATFAPVKHALIGTRLLRRHRLEIEFRSGSVLLQKSALLLG